MNNKTTRIVQFASAILCVMVAALTLNATAGDLEPPEAPAPTMKTLDQVEPRIPIPGSDTPVAAFIISDPGSYYLAGDRKASAYGIVVNADDVSIDLMGFTLSGSDTGINYGISLTNQKNVSIRNGTVRDFGSRGIRGDSTGEGHRIIGVRVLSNGNIGIDLRGKNHLIKECTVAGNSTGIKSGTGCTIEGNVSYDNAGDGIFAGQGSTVAGNTVYHNTSYGIWTQSGCTVIGNSSHSSQVTGFYIGEGSTVKANTAYGSQHYGITLQGNSLVDQNTAYNNNQVGQSYANMMAYAACTFGVNHAP